MPQDYREARAQAQARYGELLAKYSDECKAEGEKVRAVGGLYVLGTERHESRRIDNQLRGRAGRQGDPGESRFYLSLDDELMRLFATGAMSWVMGKALPEDVPIEARMVTKAIERAQNTVEQRNAEIRKNVLKYDEVLNEQRKVIYKRRDQILEGRDLKEEALEYLADAVDSTIHTYCVAEFAEEWDVDGLLAELQGFYPTELDAEAVRQCSGTDEIYDTVMGEATAYYDRREEELTPEVMREVERQVMLRIIDQRWREHLYEMDYLQEGIHLRAMGQQDPLVAWQQDGYQMFSQMMHGIAIDFVRYVMHVQVVREDDPNANVSNVQTSGGDQAVSGAASMQAAAAGMPREDGGEAAPAALPASEPEQMKPVVKSDWEKTPRNALCPCGSGKKYKLCHGR
jgi:preprotein translocase subunit SecA